MEDQDKKETSQGKTETQVSDAELLRRKLLGKLEEVIEDSKTVGLDVISLHTKASAVWSEAIKNKKLNEIMSLDMQRKRFALHQMMNIDIKKDGDPIKVRYNPTLWLEKIPKEYEGREEEYLLGKVKTLKDFFENLKV